MTTVAESKVDLDVIEGDARQRIEQLREQCQRIAPEAFTDEARAAELRAVEAELADAERALERVGLARREQERRVKEAQREAEEQGRLDALERARELQAEREAAAREVDAAFAAAGAALAGLDRICTEQAKQLRGSGMDMESVNPLPAAWHLEAALNFALIQANVPTGMLTLAPRVSGVTPQPFAAVDSTLVEPKVKAKRKR